ncbi:MAG: hypothetical protein ACTSVI_02745 [Promethearchaeota archaeon]
MPKDLEIDVSDIQSIEISHQFNQDSDWVILEEEKFKAVSFFDANLQKALVLVLKEHENAKNYIKQMKELGNLLLPLVGDIGSSELEERLENAFKMVQAMISPAEIVLLTFSEKIQQLENDKLDLIVRLEAVASIISDLKAKILLLLLINEDGLSLNEMLSKNQFENVKKEDIIEILNALINDNHVIFSPNSNIYKINPKIDHLIFRNEINEHS